MDLYVIGIILYVAFLVGVGVYKSRAVKTQDDFMVAGRNTSALFLAGTLVCTWIGSGSLFGSAGLGFREGFSALWMSAGAWIGIGIVYFLAHRVRRIAQYTVSDILEKRYNASARLFGSITIIIAYITIVGYQFRGGGRLLYILTGIDPLIGGAIVCGVVILFTVVAGMVSVITIDLFNGIMMIIGVLLALGIVFVTGGGTVQLNSLPADHFALFGQHDAVWALGVFFPTFFLLLGEGSMYQKFFAARDESTARKAVIGMIIGVVLLETAIATLAIFGSSKYYAIAPFANPDGSLVKVTTETIILHMARFDIPQFAGILLLCAAVAIILSTANTFLIIPSTNITRDIYQRFINPEVSQASILKFQRMWIIILGVTAFVIANFFKSILDMAFTAYTMVGAGITPALLAAFLWKRVTIAGGVSSIGAGMGVTLVITILNILLPEPVLDTDYIILPAAIASIVCLIVVSLLTSASPETKWKPFMDSKKG